MFRIWYFMFHHFSNEPDTEIEYITGLKSIEESLKRYKNLLSAFSEQNINERGLECGLEQLVDGEWNEYYNPSGWNIDRMMDQEEFEKLGII